MGLMDLQVSRIRKEVAKLKQLYEESSRSDRRVAVFGLYNHGKSTLLNQLVGDYKNETFRVADARETRKEQSVKVGDVEFVDTPGLNADDYDTKTALDALKMSDVYLFVHNVKTGELSQPEANFLKAVSKNLDAKEFLKACIFVVTRAGQVSETDIENEKGRIKEQLAEIFGKNLPVNIVSVDSVDYAKGKLENKPLLVKSGNVDTLNNLLRNTLKANVVEKRRAEIASMATETLKGVKKMLDEVYAKKEGLQAKFGEIRDELTRSVQSYNNIRY